MAASPRNEPHGPARTLLAALPVALLLAAAAAAQTAPVTPAGDSAPPLALPANLPISIDAASSEVDYRSNHVVFRDVVITQGTARVAADHASATGLDFRDSTWVFSGHVRIERDGGALESDEARVQFRDNQLRVATITGQPARFEQQLARSPDKAHGRATTIVYDLATGRVTFSGDAWLTDGRNEIGGTELVYNVREQRVVAEQQPGSDGRVRITIRPQDTSGRRSEPPP